jgi:hypothetical protein
MFAGQISKQVGKVLSASVANFSAALSRYVKKTISAVQSVFAAQLRKRTLRVMNSEMYQHSAQMVRIAQKTASAYMGSFAGSLGTMAGKCFTATMSFSAGLLKHTSHSINATLVQFSAEIAPRRVIAWVIDQLHVIRPMVASLLGVRSATLEVNGILTKSFVVTASGLLVE